MFIRKNIQFFLLILFLISSCGGKRLGEYDTLPELTAIDVNQPKDVVFEGESETIWHDLPVECPYFQIVLLHDTSKDEVIGIGNQLSVKAKVFDMSQGKPAAEYPVEFEIVSVKDEQDQEILNPDPSEGYGQLSVKAAYTDEYGIVFIMFSAGSKPNIKYSIKVSGSCASEDTLNVFVTDVPRGDIKVCLDYEGAISKNSLKTIKVSLLPGDYTCGELSPEKPLVNTLADKTLPDIYACTKFEKVAAETHYTLFATAKGPYGGLTAYGCHDGVLALAEKTTEITLKLYLVTLNPTGMYDCTDHFDFTNVLKDCAGGIVDPIECFVGNSGLGMTQMICCSLYQIVNFFQNPGQLIVSLLFDLAKQFLPSIVVDIGEALLGKIIADVITNWLKNDSPDWIKNFFTIGEDITSIVTNLELYSDLKLSKLNNDFSIEGCHFWKGLALYWKLGCDPKDPDYEQCGKIVFTLEDIKDTEFPLDILGGCFNASIADWNKLIIHTHKIDFSYGKLILFVLNELIIKNITDGKANTLTEAVKLWIDCKAISEGLFGDLFQVVTLGLLDKKDVEKVCDGMISTLAGFVTAFLGALTLDTNLSIQGSCIMVDMDDNLKLDQLKDGKYTGFIETGGGQQSAFTGYFYCTKK
jgi:hypothetical protein